MRLITAVILTVFLVGCSAGSSTIEQMTTGDFSLSILPETAVHGTSECAWVTVVEPTADGCIVSITASGANSQKALYFDLAYDAEALHPVAATPVAEIADCEPLSIAVLDDRSTVHYGQILPNPAECDGFNGDGVVATVEFKRGAVGCERRVSQVPVSQNGAVWLDDLFPDKLEWFFENTGDCNQDGLVNVSDLTPIALNFDHITDFTTINFNVGSPAWMADTNQDGFVTVADLTGIGQNYGNSVLGGYRIYTSLSLDDYPDPPAGPSGENAQLLASIAFDGASADLTLGRRNYEFVVQSPDPLHYYWVRPLDSDGTEGIASNAIMQIGLGVPRTPGAGAELIWKESSNNLQWYFNSPGDYNQNGVVDPADLTPVGAHWGDAGPFASSARECLVDYNNDNVIDIHDAILVSQNYNTDDVVEGYNIYTTSDSLDYPDRYDALDVISPIAFIALSESVYWEDPQWDIRLSFNHTVGSPEPGTYYWVRLVDMNGLVGEPSNMIQIP